MDKISYEQFPDVDPKFLDTLNSTMCPPARSYIAAFGFNLEVAWLNCDNPNWMSWILLAIDLHNIHYGLNVLRYDRIRFILKKHQVEHGDKDACIYVRSVLPEITPLLPKKEKI